MSVQKRAFYDPVTRVLKGWVHQDSSEQLNKANESGDIVRVVPLDYAARPRTVRLNAAGDGDEPYVDLPVVPTTSEVFDAASMRWIKAVAIALGTHPNLGLTLAQVKARVVAEYDKLT